MIEEWKDIKGFEGYFQVSNLGKVKRLYRYCEVKTRYGIKPYEVEEKIMPQFTWQSRYLRVDISYSRNKKHYRRATYVHNLVAEAFIGDRPDGYVIDHIDGNYLNNNVDNLRYVTQLENCHNPNNKPGMKGHICTKEEREYISLRTKEGMKRPDVIEKLHKRKRDKMVNSLD